MKLMSVKSAVNDNDLLFLITVCFSACAICCRSTIFHISGSRFITDAGLITDCAGLFAVVSLIGGLGLCIVAGLIGYAGLFAIVSLFGGLGLCIVAGFIGYTGLFAVVSLFGGVVLFNFSRSRLLRLSRRLLSILLLFSCGAAGHAGESHHTNKCKYCGMLSVLRNSVPLVFIICLSFQIVYFKSMLAFDVFIIKDKS